MAERISLSTDVLQIEDVAMFYNDATKSVRYYYESPTLDQLDRKFIGYSRQEAQRERDERIGMLDSISAFSLFAALEASFRIDFHVRCHQKHKDPLSRKFRTLHKTKRNRVSFEDDILEIWKTHFPSAKSVISDLKSAMLYRHWLAHGRYWIPKLGRKHDFASVYYVAQRVAKSLPLKTN